MKKVGGGANHSSHLDIIHYNGNVGPLTELLFSIIIIIITNLIQSAEL